MMDDWNVLSLTYSKNIDDYIIFLADDDMSTILSHDFKS